MMILAVVSSLNILGRETDSLTLLRADLGLAPPDPDQDAASIRRDLEAKLADHLTGLAPDAVVSYLIMLMPFFDSLGVGPEGAAILEACLGLRPDDYRSSRRLQARLQPALWSVTRHEGRPSLPLWLVALLASADRHDDAIALIHWIVGVDPSDYRHLDKLERKWRAFCDRNYPDIGSTVWVSWIRRAHRR